MRAGPGVVVAAFVLGAAVTGVFVVRHEMTLASATANPACDPSFIGVPGSGQTNGSSAEMSAVGASLTQDANAGGQNLRSNVILTYMAVPYYRYFLGKLDVPWNELGVSEAQGEQILLAQIDSDRAAAAAAGCPDAPILLSGYSQGAEVVVRAVDALSQPVRDTVSVALLGNPSFTPNVAGDLDLNTVAYEGVRPSLTTQTYTLVPDVIGRTLDICAASDPICAYHLSEVLGLVDGRSAHYHYMSIQYKGVSLTQTAGNFLWSSRHRAQPSGGGGTGGTSGGATGSGTTGRGTASGGTVTLARGAGAPRGSWYSVSLRGFPAGALVSLTCFDTASPNGFYTRSVTADGSGGAAVPRLCYSGDGPDHWVTANGAASNHVTWGTTASGGSGTSTGGSGTGNPPTGGAVAGGSTGGNAAPGGQPTGGGNPTPASIQIGWSTAHPTWITMTVAGFAPGAYQYTCDFASGGDQSYPVDISASPQAWDNGHTCYDGIAGDRVWVTIGSVASNTITVPGSAPPPPPPAPATYAETAGGAANTWTDYADGGGTQGPTVAGYATIQVSCVVHGLAVADGNTYWYRIASSPWNNAYYVSADAFYNDGATSGSLSGTPYVDPAVPAC